LSAAANFCKTMLMRRLQNDSEADLRRSLFAQVFSMRWSVLSGERAGRLAKSFVQDTQFAAIGLFYLLYATSFAVAAATYIVLSFFLSVPLTLMTVAFSLLMAPVFLVLARRGRRSSSAAAGAMEELSANLLDVATNPKFVVSQNLLPLFTSRFGMGVDRYRVERSRNDAQAAVLRLAFEAAAVAFVATYLWVSLRVLDEPIGLALVFLVIFYRLGPKILSFQDHLFKALSYAVWLDQLLELQSTATAERERYAGRIPPSLDTAVELVDVQFRHGGIDPPLLAGASLTLPARSCVAVVGPSGQGKTTLLDLIAGLYEPQSGSVLVDGVPMDDLDLSLWRSRIGIVLQESPLFNASIRENIVLDRWPPDEIRLAEVCAMTRVDEFAVRLPQGLDTVVGERGSQISGGQRQRIAMARALYRDPLLLVLDEATSSLDAATEEVIVSTLRTLKGRMSMLIVSHGSRALDLADYVYRLENGALTEQVKEAGRGSAGASQPRVESR
ncbi:MAG: ABC transporter ATP-binding protein, partial [Gaiellales bacterium]